MPQDIDPTEFTIRHAQYGHGAGEINTLIVPTPFSITPIETEEEKRKRLFKEKIASLSAADLLNELLIASNTARKIRDMEKHRVDRKRRNKAAAKSRARNR